MFNKKKNVKEKKDKTHLGKRFTKKRVVLSLLLSFAFPFILIICHSLNAYFNNANQFNFTVWDFLPLQILTSLMVMAVLFASLIFTRGKVHKFLFSLYCGIMIASCLQAFVTTFTMGNLPGDGGERPSWTWMIIDLVLWIGVLAVCVWFGTYWKDSNKGKRLLSFGVLITVVMQSVMVVPTIITHIANGGSKASGPVAYLSTENMFELSSKDNIIVFCLDRFDTKYYRSVVASDPDFFDDLDGFTYYSNNVSAYPRTYPAVTSLITGDYQDEAFTLDREEYFDRAFTSSTFLEALDYNNYKTNLYISKYYSYDNGEIFKDKVGNYAVSDDYSINNHVGLSYWMGALGAYFWLPDIAKSQTVSTAFFEIYVERNGEYPQYCLDDPKTYENFRNTGLYTQDDKNTFSFIHLRGCHAPYTMNENGKLVAATSAANQTKGCFNLVKEYLAQMKKLGIYKDATIIITGDHGDIEDKNGTKYNSATTTALFVKESGKEGTPLKISEAPVSQSNFLATIAESAELKNCQDFGVPYSKVDVNSTTPRYHYLQTQPRSGEDVNYRYEIVGDANEFDNWKITGEWVIGNLYE